jgi:hypothetical protein
MKYKDEAEIPMMMNPPLSAIINNAKSSIAPSSPTTSTAGLDGLHVSADVTIIPRDNAGSAHTNVQTTTRHTRSSETSPELVDQLARQMKKRWLPKWSGSHAQSANETALLICFSCTRRPGQKSAARIIDERLYNIKMTIEKLAEPSDGFTDNDRELVLQLVTGNRELVEAYDGYVVELMAEMECGPSWSKEIREIERLCKAWETAYPRGQWTTCIEKLGELDECVVVDWETVRERIWKFHDEKRKKEKEKGQQMSAEDESESGGLSEFESSVHESIGGTGIFCPKQGGAKILAEELNGFESNQSDGSIGEIEIVNESMEYISPSNIVPKEDNFEVTGEMIVSLENYAAEMMKLKEKSTATNTPPTCNLSLHPNESDR